MNVGEAAHIFGAMPKSARYDPKMTPLDRASIENGIWLCNNCHKLVDTDEDRFPAGLLFEWQRGHESLISGLIGKTGVEYRMRYMKRHLDEFGSLSYLAERLITEKGEFWEYRLTSEMLKVEMAPIIRRWSHLRKGLYTKPLNRLDKSVTISWMQDRIYEIMGMVAAFTEIMNSEFGEAWGAPGVAGDDHKIVSCCRLFAELCSSALIWEEQVRFVKVVDYFEETRELLVGIAGNIIEEAAKVPAFVSNMLDRGPLSRGTYKLSLVLNVPDGWGEKIAAALTRAAESYIADLSP